MHGVTKKNRSNHFFMHVLPTPKIASLNLGIHIFSYSERPIHSKRHVKGILCIEFKENPFSYFSLRESLPKLEIGIPDLGFRQCFCSKRLFNPKRHLKGNYYMLFEEKHSSRFFETRTSEI